MSTNGIKTNFWGPHAWAFLFSTIAGSYPIRVDTSNKNHMKIVKSFQSMFKSLEYTLPCIYCRQSYGKFIKELSFTKYENSRRDMMHWLYLLHDKVNAKLIKQERECYEELREEIMKKNISADQQKKQLKQLKLETIKTKPSPPFERVLATYESHRAGCNKRSRKCS